VLKLKEWSGTSQKIAIDVSLALKQANASQAIQKLLASESLLVDEEISLGRLNSFCVLMGYEPMVMLATGPVLDSRIPLIIKSNPGFFKDLRLLETLNE